MHFSPLLPLTLTTLLGMGMGLTAASPIQPSSSAPSSSPSVSPYPMHQPAFHTTPLEVTLQHLGNTTLKATITNHGTDTLRVLKSGSILDTSLPGRKVVVVDRKGHELPYTGLNIHILSQTPTVKEAAKQQKEKRIVITPTTTPSSSLLSLSASQSASAVFDIAPEYSLQSGEVYTVFAEGSLSYVTMTKAKMETGDGFLHAGYRSNVVFVRAP